MQKRRRPSQWILFPILIFVALVVLRRTERLPPVQPDRVDQPTTTPTERTEGSTPAESPAESPAKSPSGAGTPTTKATRDKLLNAIESQRSDVLVEGQGTVSRILSDDRQGDRHQRFILRLPSGHTLLVAHNIDLAPRVANLKVGDVVRFAGEYEWNSEGGVLHWTHHDPAGRHQGGWLEHAGRRFE